MDKIKGLPDEFDGRGETKGYKFKRLSSPDGTFIYEVYNNHTKYYEGFLERINSRFGNVSYPTSKAFGSWAWWGNTYDGMVKKLEIELSRRENGA